MRDWTIRLGRAVPFLGLDGTPGELHQQFERLGRQPTGGVRDGWARGLRLESPGESTWAGARIMDCRLPATGTLQLDRASVDRCDGRSVALDLSGAASHWSLCDFSRARLEGAQPDSQWSLVSLAEASLTGLDLSGARLVGVDLSDARLRDVSLKGARLVSCDLSGAHLDSCDLTGAELSGCLLIGARLSGCTTDELRAPATRIDGLTGPAEALRKAGALPPGGPLERLLRGALTRLMGPGSLPEQAARWTVRIGLGALLIVAPGWLAAQAIRQGSGHHGGGHHDEEEPDWEVQPTDEILQEKAQQSLEAIRDGLEAFHTRHGRYPRIDEAENNFGEGGSIWDEVPDNPLTGSGNGWGEFCNPQPAQSMLTGDDSDWHYCPESGRVFARSGFTDAPTLVW